MNTKISVIVISIKAIIYLYYIIRMPVPLMKATWCSFRSSHFKLKSFYYELNEKNIKYPRRAGVSRKSERIIIR